MNLLPGSALFLINQYAGVKFSKDLLEDLKYKIVDKKLDEFKIQIEEQFMLYRNFVDQDISFEEYINTIMNLDKRNNYLHFFSNCECCRRHTNTGKIRLYPKTHNFVYIPDVNNTVMQCGCPCRHFKRFIERSMSR